MRLNPREKHFANKLLYKGNNETVFSPDTLICIYWLQNDAGKTKHIKHIYIYIYITI